MRTTATRPCENEVTILARVFGKEGGMLSEEMARHILDLGFSDRDKARMHDLVVRNQDDALSSSEKQELLAFGKAGDLLAILKSKARRTLRTKLGNPPLPETFMDVALTRLVWQRAKHRCEYCQLMIRFVSSFVRS